MSISAMSLYSLAALLVWSCNIKEPVAPLKFSYSAEQIKSLCTTGQNQLKETITGIGKLPTEQSSFASTVQALEKALTDFNNSLSSVLFLKYVSPAKDIREAADACENEVQQLLVDVFVREDLFRVVKTAKSKGESLPAEDTQLMDEYLVQFKRNGLELAAEPRKVFTEKKKRLVLIESEFAKNLVEEKDHLEVTRAELEGLSDDYIQGLTKTPDGKYRIVLDYPRYFPFMENGKNAEARRKLELKFNNRGGEKNKALLEEAISLRHELARMLGYPNHAAFVLERRWAEKPSTVTEFINKLGSKLKPIGEKNLQELLALKREEMGDPSIKEIHGWDWRYYENQLKKKKHQIDHQLIKEYFPLPVVQKGMLEIYQTLLGVKFVKEASPSIWHESVELYRIQQGEETIAFFYLDLFPREGKYSHAAAFTLTTGYQRTDGGYSAPSSSIVANFNPPAGGKPALLEHSEVETLFHEFGHIMHQTLTRAKYSTFAGTSVKTDYVEAPSQMLENWVWRKETLSKLSGHYDKPSKPLPEELIQRLVAAKLANAGIRYLRQVAFANIDMAYHTTDKVDSTEIYQRYMRDVMLIPVQDGTLPQASFGHLMGGYDAGYYGYLWSEVYAQDMFTRFEREGLLDKKAGADYRKWILEPGGQRPPLELVKGFLGREPNEEAFLKSLGLTLGSGRR